MFFLLKSICSSSKIEIGFSNFKHHGAKFRERQQWPLSSEKQTKILMFWQRKQIILNWIKDLIISSEIKWPADLGLAVL